MITTLIELARDIGDFFARRKVERRQVLDRVADYMDSIADVLDRAARAYGRGEAPYREYVELQQLATSFREIAQHAFVLEEEDEPSTGDLINFEEFSQLLTHSLKAISYSDMVLFGLIDQPFPVHLWDGKSPSVELEGLSNPPVGESRLDTPRFPTGNAPPEPSVHELLQAAGAFAAQARVIRSSSR